MSPRSIAERLDRAVDQLLAGARPATDTQLAPLVAAASRVQAVLVPPPIGAEFETRLASRLEEAAAGAGGAAWLRGVARRQLQHPRRLIAAGALSSAAVGMTVTAVALWRTSRRQAHPIRLGHR
ncbi:MAG TPA: hypothetical protein VFH63_09350 [candidate division Zixibacteria bacterium]|nr:hypothetical protein [candidate division Zixibacteria bacterium]